jgi:predicted RND superfamily exporter protein
MEVVVTVDRDKCDLSFAEKMRMARDIERAMETLPEVGGAISAATMVPDLGSHKFVHKRMNAFQRAAENTQSKRLEEHRKEFTEYLQVDEKANEELWRISGRVEALSDLDYGKFVDDIKHRVQPVMDFYKANGVDGLEVTYTGLVPLVYKAQTELLDGLFNSLLMAFVLIAIVMMLVLRSFSAGVLSMVPNLFPVVVIFGAMGWAGSLVDVGTMMTASVALGVAVDDTIHYLSWFRHGLDVGYNRKGAAMLAYERCATAMTQTTLIAGFGLAVFALSTFTPTQRFGYMMLALLMAALVGDLVLLPALLAGPFGRFFDKKSGTKDHPLLAPGGSGTVPMPSSPDAEVEGEEADSQRIKPRRRSG